VKKKNKTKAIKPSVLKNPGSPVFTGFVWFTPVQLLIWSNSQTKPQKLRFPV
jgi:hypothetical protein